MYSHTFTSEDAARKADKKLYNFTFFDPQYDTLCKLEDGSVKMNTDGIQESFNKDINRNPNLYIETEQGIIDLTQEIKIKYGDDHIILYGDVYDALTDKYKLSRNQAEYILATAYQGSIAGGLTGFASLLADHITDPMKYMNRNGNMSKIIIDKNNNLSYVGGQKMTFDCDRTAYNDIIRATVHTNFQSQDYVAATISAQLGQLGKSEFKPEIIINAVGNGSTGAKIIKELQKIESHIPSLPSEEALEKYHNFSNSIMEVNGQHKLYQQVIKAEVSKILMLDSLEINKVEVENLKKLNFAPEVLSEIILNQIDEKLNILSIKDNNITSDNKKTIANDMAKGLAKFIDLPKGYIDRFSKDMVNQLIQSKELNHPKNNIIQTMVSYFKDSWHGYNRHNIKNILLIDLQAKSEEISSRIKRPLQDNMRTHVENIKKQKIDRGRS